MNFLPGMPGFSNGEKKEENATFSQDDLELQWMAMCNRMPQKQTQLIGLATRMKNMVPMIMDFPVVEVVVGNELIRDEMEKIHGSIENTLKVYLHNSAITLTVRVEEQKSDVKILTRKEQFEELTKDNPSVEKLRLEFDLELA